MKYYLVKVFDLLNGEIEKVESGSDGNERLGPSATHGRPQTPIQLYNDQFIEKILFFSRIQRLCFRTDIQVFFNLNICV